MTTTLRTWVKKIFFDSAIKELTVCSHTTILPLLMALRLETRPTLGILASEILKISDPKLTAIILKICNPISHDSRKSPQHEG